MTQLERSLLPNFSVPSAPVQVLVHLLQASAALHELAVSLLHCVRHAALGPASARQGLVKTEAVVRAHAPPSLCHDRDRLHCVQCTFMVTCCAFALCSIQMKQLAAALTLT